MPTYDFLNTKTGKEFSEFMSISEKETYLKHNSHIQQKVSSINIISVLEVSKMMEAGKNYNQR